MKRFLIALVAWSVLTSCTPSTTPPGGSETAGVVASPQINEQTRGEIQALLQKQVNAMASRDQTTFQSTVDQDRGALRRCANEAYDRAGREGVGSATQVSKIEAYGPYVRAYVQESNGLRRIFFRKVDGKWVQTEPKDDELGGEKTMTVEDIKVDYWGIDEDIAPALAKGAVAAKQIVLANLLSDNRRDALEVRFYPTRGVAVAIACAVAGYHLSNVASDPVIRILRYWIDASGQPTPITVALMSHEWLHWAQDQFIPGVNARLPWWLSEGWPDYVGQSRSLSANKFVICQTAMPTLKQLEDGADPNGPPENAVNYYSWANTMVEYLYTTYGGKDVYRNLLLAFKDDAVPANVFPKVLKITPQQFYDDYKAWAKKKLC